MAGSWPNSNPPPPRNRLAPSPRKNRLASPKSPTLLFWVISWKGSMGHWSGESSQKFWDQRTPPPAVRTKAPPTHPSLSYPSNLLWGMVAGSQVRYRVSNPPPRPPLREGGGAWHGRIPPHAPKGRQQRDWGPRGDPRRHEVRPSSSRGGVGWVVGYIFCLTLSGLCSSCFLDLKGLGKVFRRYGKGPLMAIPLVWVQIFTRINMHLKGDIKNAQKVFYKIKKVFYKINLRFYSAC